MIIYNKQNGQIALLLTLVILGAILSIGLGLTLVTVKEMKMAKNIEESNMALQAADAGIEYALYRVDNNLSVGRLCSSSNGWINLDNSSQYCIEIVNGTVDDPETMKSIGKFGNVKRSILFDKTEIFNPDQYSNYSHSGPEPCTAGDCSDCGNCIFPGGVHDRWNRSTLSKRVGQTFHTDTTGYITQITVWSGGVTGCNCRGACGYGYWRVELRDINGTQPGNNVLATSNIISVITTSCVQRDFNFSVPYEVTKGSAYSFVIKNTYGNGNEINSDSWDERIGIKMADNGFYSGGRAWYAGRDLVWRSSCDGGSCPDSGSDCMFEITVDPLWGGTGGVMGDLEETRP